jgi:hypothetical protein
MEASIPILRIYDEAKARDHYLGFLGFKLDWEHRFEANSPVFMQVSRDRCILNLSEHFGDGTPGSSIRIETPNLDEFGAELRSKNYKYAKPGQPIDQSWGTRELCITDPFGNCLIFYCETKTS